MFTDKMKTFLVDLDLNRVDLVKEGANTKAQIKLLKRKETQPMTFEEIMKSLNAEHAEIINKALEDARKENADALATATVELEKAKEELENTKTELEKSKEAITKAKPNEEDELSVLLKSVNPALAKHIEGLQSTVKTLVDEKAEQVAKARFDSVKAIPVEEAKLKEVLKAASPAVYEVLQAASSAIEKNLLTGKGFDTANGTDDDNTKAYATLEKSAKKLQETEPGLSYEAAFLRACTLDPETYSKMK